MRVLLVPNTLNPAAVSATVELATWLTAQGFTPVLATDDAVGVGLADYGVAPTEIGEPVLVVALAATARFSRPCTSSARSRCPCSA